MRKLVLVVLSCMAFTVNAASFTVIGGVADTLPGNFTDFNGALAPNISSDITVFNGAFTGGVSLNYDADLRFTYLGTEAAFENEGFTGTGAVVSFNNKTSTIGDFAEEFTLAGLIDFTYETFGQTGAACHTAPGGCSIVNGVGSSLASLWLGVYEDTVNDSIILLFGDGIGDSDFDDMAIRVSVVPVPAAIWLFGSALLAFAGFSTRRKAAA